MKLYVPACGDRIVLSAGWTFPLVLEHRNMRFAKAAGLLPAGERGWDVYEGERYRSRLAEREVTLPAGTVLECDRVYIRQFNRSRVREDEDYDSITWRALRPEGRRRRGEPAPPHGRFWVKLSRCNGLEFEPGPLYRDRVKLARLVLGD